MVFEERQRLEKAVSRGWLAAMIGAAVSVVFLFPITFICSVFAFGSGLGVCYREGFGKPGAKLMAASLIGPAILLVWVFLIALKKGL